MVVVTGASDGLGLAATGLLAEAGAHVVMACRNRLKAERALTSLTRRSSVQIGEVDLADLDSVRRFAQWFLDGHDRLDILINNAGVMTPPPTLSAQRIELQWATNHLAHFALTGLLLDSLLAAEAGRVVAVSSLAATSGNIDDRDPTTLDGYRRFAAYADSKLANLVFAVELDRRLRAVGANAMSVAAHPGITHTNLSSGIGLRFLNPPLRLLSRLLTQSVADGVAPIMRAATDPTVEGGQYFGPGGDRQRRGPAVEIPLPAGVDDAARGQRLWERSEALCDVRWLSD